MGFWANHWGKVCGFGVILVIVLSIGFNDLMGVPPSNTDVPTPRANSFVEPENNIIEEYEQRAPYSMCVTEENSGVPRSWPWMAALLRDGHLAPCCSGVLLSDGHVLTAAHCVDERGECGSDPASLTVRLCGYDNTTDEVRHQDYAVQSVRQHEGFVYEDTGKHDIALLVLEKKVQFNDHVQPASLSQADEPCDSQEAVVTAYRGTRLEEVPVRVWSSEQCRGVVNSEKRHSVLDNFLCTSNRDSRKCVEKRHGGGPLQVQTPSGEWEVVGIVSFGSYKHRRSPVVYVKVFKYLHWIRDST